MADTLLQSLASLSALCLNILWGISIDSTYLSLLVEFYGEDSLTYYGILVALAILSLFSEGDNLNNDDEDDGFGQIKRIKVVLSQRYHTMVMK